MLGFTVALFLLPPGLSIITHLLKTKPCGSPSKVKNMYKKKCNFEGMMVNERDEVNLSKQRVFIWVSPHQ